MDITKLSKEELDDLQKQIILQQNKIKENELNKKREVIKKKIEKLREHKDLLLELVSHTRTSCSDNNLCNGWGSADYGARCSKCHLIEILNGEFDDGQFDIDIDVTITKID